MGERQLPLSSSTSLMIFNLSRKRGQFCERYPKEIGVPFDVILMANMTTESIKQLREAGCVYARIAIEAASTTSATRSSVRTRRKQLTDAAGWIKKGSAGT